MQEKTFSCRKTGANYFGFATFSPSTPTQPGSFFCEVLDPACLTYYSQQKIFDNLQQAKYQHIFDILGHNNNGYTLAGNQLRIDAPATPGILIIVKLHTFASADERLTTLGKLMQKEVDYLRGEVQVAHSRGQIVYYPLPNPLTWEECRAYATQKGKRLPTQAEIVIDLNINGFVPKFGEDEWVPVLDGWNEWVSVGNQDPKVRLGRNHTQVAGQRPQWGLDNSCHVYRKYIALTQ